jgi:hypothetical protein
MTRSRAEALEILGRLLAEYTEFQRRRPDLPQGDLSELSEYELDTLVTAFQLNRPADSAEAEKRPQRPLLH